MRQSVLSRETGLENRCMTKNLTVGFLFWLIIMLLSRSAQAKRVAPTPVAPVIANGIRYSADGDGRDQYVVAADVTTGKELWKVRVFRTRVNSWREIDVQLVFITTLKLAGNSLLVRDEKARCYSVDLKSHHVKRSGCGQMLGQ